MAQKLLGWPSTGCLLLLVVRSPGDGRVSLGQAWAALNLKGLQECSDVYSNTKKYE